LTILLIEDGTEVELFTLYRRLKDSGFDVRHVGDPESEGFIPSVKEAAAGLICVGTKSPDAGGLAICRRLKSDPELALVPVFMISVADVELTEGQLVEAGIERVFPPPLNLDTIVAAIAERTSSGSPISTRVFTETPLSGTVGMLLLSLREKRWTGMVHLSSAGSEARIKLLNGKVVEAVKNGVQEEETLMELIKWDSGVYSLEEQAVESSTPEQTVEETAAKSASAPPSSDSILDAVSEIEGVLGVIKVATDGDAVVSKNLDKEKAAQCCAGIAYCGNAADTIGKVWNLGRFLHGAIVGEGCKLLLHQDGEEFVGTSIAMDVSAKRIGTQIERLLGQQKERP